MEDKLLIEECRRYLITQGYDYFFVFFNSGRDIKGFTKMWYPCEFKKIEQKYTSMKIY